MSHDSDKTASDKPGAIHLQAPIASYMLVTKILLKDRNLSHFNQSGLKHSLSSLRIEKNQQISDCVWR